MPKYNYHDILVMIILTFEVKKMESITVKKGQYIYEAGSISENIYRLVSGKIEISHNGNKNIIETGTFGEWIIAGAKCYDSAYTLTDCQIQILTPEDLNSLDSKENIYFEMFESLTKRLTFLDECISSQIDQESAINTFKRFHPHHKLRTESKFLDFFSKMKFLYNQENYQQALNEVYAFKSDYIDYPLRDELDIWKAIITFHLDPEKAKHLYNTFDHAKYSKKLSFTYLKNLLENKNDTLLSLYEKYGIHVPPNTILIAEGENPNNEGYLLLDGGMKVGRYSGNKEILLSIIQKGDFFGEAGMFNSNCRMATVYTDVYCDVVKMSGEKLKSVISQFPALGMKMVKCQISRITFLDELFKTVCITNKRERITSIIDTYLEKFITVGITLNEFTSLTNCTQREVLEIFSNRKIKIDSTGHIKTS